MKRLTKKQMWIFAIGQLGWSILGGIINACLIAFYLPTSEKVDGKEVFSGTKIAFFNIMDPRLLILGVISILGLITALCRVWDAVSDPVIANLSDNSRNPKGRRIPFMRFAAIPFALITLLVFMAPSLFYGGQEPTGWNIAWVAIMLVLFYTFMTIYCTPYNALISEFGKTQEDRMFISTAISLTYFAGTLLAYTPYVTAGLFASKVGFYWSYIISFAPLIVIACVAMLIPTFCLKETDFVESKPANSNAFKSLAKTFKNKDFRVFTASDLMYWIGLTLFQTGLPFFVVVSMKLTTFYTTVFMGVMTVLSAAFYPFVTKLVKKFGKKKLVIAGFLGLSLAYLITALINVLSFIPGIVLGFVICVVAAFPMSLLGIIPQSIVADVAEADSVDSGEKREGMFFAARTFAMKLGQSIAMLVFTTFAIIGSTASFEELRQSTQLRPNTTGLMIAGFAAVAFCVAGAVILLFYNEKKVMKKIAKAGDESFLEAVENDKVPVENK